jgi:hypothetical protein
MKLLHRQDILGTNGFNQTFDGIWKILEVISSGLELSCQNCSQKYTLLDIHFTSSTSPFKNIAILVRPAWPDSLLSNDFPNFISVQVINQTTSNSTSLPSGIILSKSGRSPTLVGPSPYSLRSSPGVI